MVPSKIKVPETPNWCRTGKLPPWNLYLQGLTTDGLFDKGTPLHPQHCASFIKPVPSSAFGLPCCDSPWPRNTQGQRTWCLNSSHVVRYGRLTQHPCGDVKRMLQCLATEGRRHRCVTAGGNAGQYSVLRGGCALLQKSSSSRQPFISGSSRNGNKRRSPGGQPGPSVLPDLSLKHV